MEKLYLNEIRPTGEISTVGLFYSREEAEGVLRKLQEIPEKANYTYEIREATVASVSTKKDRNNP